MISKRGEFSIHRCNPQKRNDCKDESEIDLFIKDLVVDIWTVFEKMDVREYDNYPVIRVQDVLTSAIINKDL